MKICATFRILAVALSCPLVPGVAGLEHPSPAAQASSRTLPPPEERVDINTAGLDQLMTVPGMTRTWAARIIRYRPYRTKTELLDRGIVTSQVYDRIKDYIIAHHTKP